jgi:HSP20 family molecular chaperone IbpA
MERQNSGSAGFGNAGVGFRPLACSDILRSRDGRRERARRMSRQNGLSSPFMLGFDEIERALDRVAKATGDGYPPYNIERIAPSSEGPEKLRITLAVAGFARDEIEITVEDKQLLIKGRQNDDKTRQFLHRGIAARQFQRAFLLAEGLEVLGADLAHGLLSIDLTRPVAERVMRRIVIDERE